MDLARTPAGRRALFTAYYFLEGAPIGFLWWTLPSVLEARDVGPERIGALVGWLALPWAFKWLWAPLIDACQGRRFGLRTWIGAAQVGMVATLLPLLGAGGLEATDLLLPCLLAHAVFAATQDAAIDALMIRTTGRGERGRLAAWMQVGMLAGRSLLGGGALLVLARVGEQRIVLTLVVVLIAGLGLLPFYRAPANSAAEPGVRARELGERLAAALRRRTTWIGLAFAAVAGCGFEALGVFAGPLLTERAGGQTEAAGYFFLVNAVVAMAVGGLLGGVLADRIGALRGTRVTGLLLGAAILVTALVIGAGGSSPTPWLTLVYAGIGAFTAASYALFMEWTDEELGATQFSAYMGATNLCEAWSASAAGRMIPRLGYGGTLAALAGLGLLSLSLISFARHDSGARESGT